MAEGGATIERRGSGGRLTFAAGADVSDRVRSLVAAELVCCGSGEIGWELVDDDADSLQVIVTVDEAHRDRSEVQAVAVALFGTSDLEQDGDRPVVDQ